MKQTIFAFTTKEGNNIQHKLDFIYTPQSGGSVTIGERIFKCTMVIDEFTNNESAHIRQILLTEEYSIVFQQKKS
jgi:hypothetical protein